MDKITLTPHGRKALEKVAKWLEAGAPRMVTKSGRELGVFDMNYGIAPPHEATGHCGTACCIAGAVCQFEQLVELDDGGAYFHGDRGVGATARDFLGLSEQDANRLFVPWTEEGAEEATEHYDHVLAGAVIRGLLNDGVIDWNV